MLAKMDRESRPVKVNFLHGILYCKFVSIYVTVFGTWFGALYHNDHIEYKFYVYFLFHNCDINSNIVRDISDLVITIENLASLSWGQGSTLQQLITRVHTRRKQNCGGSFKWMRSLAPLTNQGLSIFQPIEYDTTSMTCKIILEPFCSCILSLHFLLIFTY